MKGTTMEGYCKLASGIILSSIWQEDDKTRIVWITMLAVKDKDHVVHGSVPGLARIANVPVEDCEAALKKLMQPDRFSRTREFDGRRISEVDGGWQVLNGEKYKNYMSKQERLEYQRLLMKDRRSKRAEKAKMLAPVSNSLACVSKVSVQTPPSPPPPSSPPTPPLSPTTPSFPPPPPPPKGGSPGLNAPIPLFLNAEPFKTTWERWMRFRRTLKAVKDWTTLFASQLKWLERFGPQVASEILEQSMRNGWQGLFELKGKAASPPRSPKTEMADILARQAKDAMGNVISWNADDKRRYLELRTKPSL